MAWPDRVYQAFVDAGIYYSAAFSGTGDQPTWAKLATGLPNDTIVSFCLDRFEVPWDTRMFCVVAGAVYRKTTGNWAAVLTDAQAATVTGYTGGQTLDQIITDPITGYVYVTFCKLSAAAPIAVLRSTDHGDNWTYAQVSGSNYTPLATNIDAYDGVVYVGMCITYMSTGYLRISTNHGVSWGGFVEVNSLTLDIPRVRINPLLAGYAYVSVFEYGAFSQLKLVSTAGAVTLLNDGDRTGALSQGGIWFDADDVDHMLTISGSSAQEANETDDSWATFDDNALPYDGFWDIAEASESAFWVVDGDPSAVPHAAVAVTTDGYTLTDRGGPNAHSSPYANSIPDTAGAPVRRGLWAVFDAPTEGPTPPPGSTITPPGGTPVTLGGTAYVQAVTMPDYYGADRGEPLPGDRGAWDDSTETRAKLHAWDIWRSIELDTGGLYHLPHGPAVGDGVVFDGSRWNPTDVVTAAELAATDAADLTSGAATDGQVLTADGAAGAAWEDLPALANHAHAGVAGDGGQLDWDNVWTDAAHDHSAAGEGGTFDAANLTSGAATIGQALKADGAGGSEWGTIAASSGELLMQDGVTSPPIPIELEDGSDWLYEG